jgi:hypothetical protein
MKLKKFAAAICLSLLIGSSFFGCGGPKTIKTSTSPAIDQSKKLLQEVISTGNSPGSGAMIFTEVLAEIEKTDPSKAKAIKTDVDALISGGKPEELKARAKAILEKL